MQRILTAAVVVILGAAAGAPAAVGAGEVPAVGSGLAGDLERMRQALGIPGMAAAVVQDGRVAFAEGFGDADLEAGVPAAPETPFGLASVTKPVAATLVMQLVEEGIIDLDARVADYGVDIAGDPGITVRHLLTHTSEGTPGAVHRYNGDRYGFLGGVIEGAAGASFARLLSDRILLPVGMPDTALNPIGSWGGPSSSGWEDLARGLGWGEAFAGYPEVYRRLARPYQFGEGYRIVDGMYHLHHNPAAGLISSVADLARFDIALDRGDLLGSAARAEMLSPQVPTVAGRDDLHYGLGWYVQDFEGVTLIWHAGRWAPSTSALYVKIPDEGLTFLVAANTDNLTVPFPNIGIGDLSHSLPFLTFFRHAVYPRLHGTALPAVDWSGSRDDLVATLAAVVDPDARRFLERELWSYRQAFASSGDTGQADLLREVARSAFPGSALAIDPAYLSTVGKMPVVAPILSARGFASVSAVVVAWLGIVALSAGWMLVELWMSAPAGPWRWVVWPSAALVVGPVAPAVHRWGRGSLRAAVTSTAGYAAAWSLAVLLVLRVGGEPPPALLLGATLLLPFAVGLSAIRAPLIRRAGIGGYGRCLRRGVVGEIVTWGVGFSVFFPLTFWLGRRWLSTVPPPTSPYFGAILSIVGLTSVVALGLLNLALRRRRFTVWPDPGMASEEVRLPTLRDSWWIVLGVGTLAAGALAAAVVAFA